jgi:hypothetical protein
MIRESLQQIPVNGDGLVNLAQINTAGREIRLEKVCTRLQFSGFLK